MNKIIKALTILYVEDEPDLQQSICRFLEPFVARVLTAPNGEEGLRLFREQREVIDLLITDIAMPIMDGIAMVNAIRQIDTEIPIIYTTAFGDSAFLMKTIEQSVTAYILKPVDIEKLFSGIQKATVAIENRSLRQSLIDINNSLEKSIKEKTEEIQNKNTELQRQLHTDPLTQLSNRNRLMEEIGVATHPTLMLVDINAFRTYNAMYGEEVGNQILVRFVAIVQSYADRYDLSAYRSGGDTFALFEPECSDAHLCEKIAAEFIRYIAQHAIDITFYDLSIQIDVTVGIARGRETLFEKASMALKRAKETQKPYQAYDDTCDYNQVYQHDLQWKKLIEKALEEDRVVIFLQPITDAEQCIVKYEALVRIRNNDTIYSPAQFLDIAKKFKLYAQLSAAVVEQSFALAQSDGCSISINISIEDIENDAFVRRIIEDLTRLNIAQLITFEILESEYVQDYEQTIAFMNDVQHLGCKVAIDDFGSGYSNFAYLRRLRPDFLKIDGSLIRDIHTDKNAQIIVKSINHFAHSLGIVTVAEFVHSEDVFAQLKQLGTDYYQGYYLGKPSPEGALQCHQS